MSTTPLGVVHLSGAMEIGHTSLFPLPFLLCAPPFACAAMEIVTCTTLLHPGDCILSRPPTCGSLPSCFSFLSFSLLLHSNTTTCTHYTHGKKQQQVQQQWHTPSAITHSTCESPVTTESLHLCRRLAEKQKATQILAHPISPSIHPLFKEERSVLPLPDALSSRLSSPPEPPACGHNHRVPMRGRGEESWHDRGPQTCTLSHTSSRE